MERFSRGEPRVEQFTTLALAAAAVCFAGGVRASAADETGDEPDAVAADGLCVPPDRCEPVSFAQRPLVLHVVLGAGTPVGLVGGELELNIVDRLAVGIGAGVGFGGVQFAALARGRPLVWSNPQRSLAATVDLAFSLGGFQSSEYYVPLVAGEHYLPERQHEYVNMAYWVQADIGIERRNRNGFSFLATVGLGWILNAGDSYCKDDSSGAKAACRAASLGDTPSLALPKVMLTGAVGHDFM